MIYGYIRGVINCVSDKDISIPKQEEMLNKYNIDNIYKDIILNNNMNKEAFYELLNIVEQNDMVIVNKLSRICETFEELSSILNIFKEKGIILNVLELGHITPENSLIVK